MPVVIDDLSLEKEIVREYSRTFLIRRSGDALR